MTQPLPPVPGQPAGGPAPPKPVAGRARVPSPWSPSVRSAVYLPKDAPERPGAWHLPQVRAQALQVLIDDVAGWARNIHGLIVLLLGAAGAGTLLLGTSGLASGWLSVLLIGTASAALLVWAVWGLWLERSAWVAIGAVGRWQSAYLRGTGASGQVTTPSARDVVIPAMVVRLLAAVGLLACAGWAVVQATGESGAGSAHPGAYWVLAAVLGLGGLAAGATLAGLLVALRRKPSAQARARSARQAPRSEVPPDGEVPGTAPQQPAPGGEVPGTAPHQQTQGGGAPGTALRQPMPEGSGTAGSAALMSSHSAYAPPPSHPSRQQHQHSAGKEPVARPGEPSGGAPSGASAVAPSSSAARSPKATATPEAATRIPAGVVEPVPGEAALRSTAEAATPARVEMPTPEVAASGAGPAASGAGPEASGAGPEDLEATRLAHRLGPIPADTHTDSVVVRLPDGRPAPENAVSLIGRDPGAREGEQVDALLRIADQSVSKTHLCLRSNGPQVWVTDRASTNGTVLLGPDGTATDLQPWQETPVPAGSTLRLGSAELTVSGPGQTHA